MRLPNFMAIRQGLSNIGFTTSSLMVLSDCGKEIVRAAPRNFWCPSRKGCGTRYSVPPESWDITKTSGMVCSCLIIYKLVTPSRSVSGNANGFFINLGLLCSGLVAKLVSPILHNRSHSKKLLSVDEGSRYSTLVWRRSPFSTTYHFDTDVGTKRTAASCAFRLDSSKGGLLWSAQSQDRMPSDQRSNHFQRSDLWRFSSPSSATYHRKG